MAVQTQFGHVPIFRFRGSISFSPIVVMTIAREKRPRAIVSDSNDIFTRDNEYLMPSAKIFVCDKILKKKYIQNKINILILQNSLTISFTIFLIEEM